MSKITIEELKNIKAVAENKIQTTDWYGGYLQDTTKNYLAVEALHGAAQYYRGPEATVNYTFFGKALLTDTIRGQSEEEVKYKVRLWFIEKFPAVMKMITGAFQEQQMNGLIK